MTSRAVIDEHRAAGRPFAAGGVSSFVREAGEGESVVCIHGVPASCFLYRKVLAELAARGLRAVHGEAARRAAGLEQIHTVPAKHFLQEDQAPAVAQHVADLVAGP